MIQLTGQTKILVAVDPVDFRNGIDGLVGLCRRELKADPFEGCVFVFRNRSRQAIKILVYDGQGFWLHQKRLSRSRFTWWPQKGDRATEELEVYELQLLLWNGDPRFARAAGQWRKIQAG